MGLSRFDIEEEAGAGGMARVYRARDRETGELVALKVMHGAADRELRRFGREVGVLRDLSHPAIVRYVAHGHDGGRPWLAMEWLAGEDLERRLARGATGVDHALEILRRMASALGEAHARGIVHRDVKPSNVFLVDGDPSRPKLLDFGVAHDALATAGLTMAGNIVGTPSYMAPEQARGADDVDPRADVFALGGLLFACLTGRPPFMAANLVALLAKIVLDDPPRLGDLRADVPASVHRLLARLMAKRREERPLDGRAVEALLDGVESVPAPPLLSLSTEQRLVSVVLASGAVSAHAPGTIDVHGAGAIRLADGSSVVTFTGPDSPHELAARAVRVALAMKAEDVAVAVATGRAVLSSGLPVGEVIDRAAQALRPGAVRIDETTADLVEGRFRVEKDEVLCSCDGDVDRVRTLLGKPTRCVGRDRELAALEGYWDECIDESIARAVLVVAEPGVGKSRLGRELLRRLQNRPEPPRTMFAIAESVRAGSPFATLASAFRLAASVHEDDPPAERRRKLRERIGDVEDADLLADVLASEARDGSAAVFDRVRTAFSQWLAREPTPLLWMVEDVHWADAPSAALLDVALSAMEGKPFLLVGLSRPEVTARNLWASHHPHQIPLDPLGRRVAERMVRDALGRSDPVDDALVARIVDRARGNALFLEELIRAASAGRLDAVPEGVLGTLQVRFDALSTEARATLRAASVFGEQLTRSGVAALLPGVHTERAISELVEREVLGSAGDELTFRHALVRDAAYALLAEADRVLAHRLAAAHLERSGEADAARLAAHWEIANDDGQAVTWHTRAAVRAMQGNDMQAALEHVDRAKRRVPEDDRARRGGLELLTAEVEHWRGNMAEASEAARRARDLLEAGTAVWFDAVGLLITSAGQLGDNAVVLEELARATAADEPGDVSSFATCVSRAASQLVFAEYGDEARAAIARVDAVVGDRALSPYAEGRLLFARAYEAYDRAALDASAAFLDDASGAFRRAGRPRDAVQMMLLASLMRGFGGLHARAYDGLVAARAAAERLDARYLVEWASFEIALLDAAGGRIAEALEKMERVSPRIRSTPLFCGGWLGMLGWAYVDAGRWDDLAALLDAHQGLPLRKRHLALFPAFGAPLALARGDTARARALSEEGIARLDALRGLWGEPFVAGYGAIARTMGALDPDRARALLSPHVHRLRAVPIREPAFRDAYLALPWNDAVLLVAG